MKSITATIALLLFSSRAYADEGWRVQGSIHVSYLIAGGSSYPGGRAPATGGVALVPTVRVLRQYPVAEVYAAVAPIFVTPTHLATLGFVGAHDLGVALHPSSRAWYVGAGATLAPAFMRFCNLTWCLREPVLLYGGELHASGRLWGAADGSGLSFTATVRVLTGRPTAWYWPRLSPTERAVNHISVVAGGGATWAF